MQSVSSRIWTRVTVSISYDDDHYTTGTSTPPDYNEMIKYIIVPTIEEVLEIGVHKPSTLIECYILLPCVRLS